MFRHIEVFVIATAFFSVAGAPHSFAGQWLFRPGLWQAKTIRDGFIVHIPPNASEDFRAKLRAMALPGGFMQKICVRSGSKPAALYFDPEVQPSGICHEKRIYKDSDVELIVDDCLTPHLSIAGTDVPSIAAKTTRYVSLSGATKGMVWGIDSVVQKNKYLSVDMRHTLRWIGAKC